MLQFPRDMSSGNTVSNSLSSVVNTFYIYIYICVCVCVCVCKYVPRINFTTTVNLIAGLIFL